MDTEQCNCAYWLSRTLIFLYQNLQITGLNLHGDIVIIVTQLNMVSFRLFPEIKIGCIFQAFCKKNKPLL